MDYDTGPKEPMDLWLYVNREDEATGVWFTCYVYQRYAYDKHTWKQLFHGNPYQDINTAFSGVLNRLRNCNYNITISTTMPKKDD